MSEKTYPFPILVVDDEPAILEVMSANLEKKYNVHTAQTGQEALTLNDENEYAAIILDYNLPDIDGMAVLSHVKRADKDVVVIMITAHGTIEMAVESMKAGAFNYLVKPINYDEMGLLVEKAIEHHKILTELLDLRKQIDAGLEMDNIIGRSRKMLKIYEKVKVVAESDATVLIRGETGTGKELVARAIHRNSPRRNKNFVRINCAAIPETLLEAELFGYERGAFTGAVAQRIGKFERANGGTIYLDEIGEISPAMQAKLLRVLQEGEFDRMGGNETIQVDTRIVATTNRDLEAAIKEGMFRIDLFYRLNVIPIVMPPLRERQEDIALLANHFINKFGKKNNKDIKGLSPAAMATLMQHNWPGNVRELENVIERTVVLTQNNRVESIDLSLSGSNGQFVNIGGQDTTFQQAKKKVVETFETHYLSQLLKKHKGNISASAKEASLDYKNFHNKLKKYQIKKSRFE